MTEARSNYLLDKFGATIIRQVYYLISRALGLQGKGYEIQDYVLLFPLFIFLVYNIQTRCYDVGQNVKINVCL